MSLPRIVAILLLISFQPVAGQELNIGVTGGPIVGMPLRDKQSTGSPTIKMQTLNFNAQVGLNLNLRVKNFCIETGTMVATRSVVFRTDIDNMAYKSLAGSSTVSSKGTMRATGYSYSVPLQLGYKLSDHDAQTVYSVWGLLGASYEKYTSDGYTYAGSTTSTGSGTGGAVGTITNNSSSYPNPGVTSEWVDIIAGFKINAILLKVGLVEYGLRYHFPINNVGRYSVETVVANGTYGSVFTGDFYPRLSYFDFHLTYYFLNFEHGRRKSYRNY